jgi:hypothetical protein
MSAKNRQGKATAPFGWVCPVGRLHQEVVPLCCAHNLITHNLATYNLITYKLIEYNLIPYNLISYNPITYNLIMYNIGHCITLQTAERL